MNILGWEHWKVLRGDEKGPDYSFTAEYLLRPTDCPLCDASEPGFVSRGIVTGEIRDTLIHNKRVGIRIKKRRWRCHSCEGTFTDSPPELDAHRQMTARLVEALKVESFEQPFSSLADRYGISEGTVRNIFGEELNRHDEQWAPDPPEVLGIDEVHLGGYRFVAANLGAPRAALLEILPNRNRSTVEDFFAREGWCDQVRVVAMDMWAPYRIAVKAHLPHAAIVIDRFHVIKIATVIVDQIRKRVLQVATAKERRLLQGSQQVLRRRKSRLNELELEALEQWRLVSGELVLAYELKEALDEIYEAGDREEGQERLDAWLASIPPELATAFDAQVKSLQNWSEEILNYIEHRVTNAATERLNRFIRLTNELGNGYSFRVLRGRMLYGTPRVLDKYWGSPDPVTAIPGSMAFGLGSDTGRSMGADLEWLTTQMETRSGKWADPMLWRADSVG